MKIIEIKNNEDFSEKVINSKEKILVDFNADWCGPCRMLKPVLESIESDITVASVNTDNVEEVARKYGVMSIPCMVLIEAGEEKNRLIGFHQAEEIEEFIK